MPDMALPTPGDRIEQDAGAAFARGVAARRAGNREEAVAWFRRALDLEPAHQPSRRDLATILREQGRVDEAEPLYRALLAEDAASWPAMTGLGLCARLRRDLPASAEHLAAAFALAPRERSVRMEYATTLREQGRVAEAEPLYRGLLAEDARAWSAMVGLGLCARHRRDLPASAEHLAAASALAPRERTVRLEYAYTLREQRRLDEAEAIYQALLADEPRIWQAMAGLGHSARLRHDHAAAAGHFAAALQLVPRDRALRLDHATALREQRRLDEAEAAYQALLADEPQVWQALLGLGLCARLRRDLPASAGHLAAAFALAPRDRQVRLDYATTLREQGRVDEAEPLYRGLLAEDARAWPALVGLGMCVRHRRDLPVSAEYLAAALALAPRDRSVRLEYATTLREQRRLDEAEATYRAVLADEPQVWQAHLGLGLCARMRRDLAGAAEHLAATLALAPHERTARLEYAVTLREQWRLDEAEAAYRALLADEPASWQAQLGLGQCARVRNDRTQAFAHFTAAAELAPEVEGPRFELAVEHRDMRRFDEARAILHALLDHETAAAQAWLTLGYLERHAGDRAAAADIFRAGYARYPQRHQFMIEIALEERAAGRFAEVEQLLLRAAEIEDVSIAALTHLGDLARARQQFEEALELFRRAAQRPAAPAGVHASIAQTLADLGRLGEALQALDAAERQLGAWPDLALRRCSLLRRAGFRYEALAVARQAVAAAPGHFPLWYEWYEIERFSGDFANIDHCLAAAPARNVHERALVQNVRGQVAAQRWQFDAAAAAFREALALNPLLTGAHDALARASLLQFDIPTARAHLQILKQQRMPHQALQGLSPHLTHTHIGNFFDEFVIDEAALAALVEAQALAPAARVAPLLALVRGNPEHTATAIALLLALRQAGQFAAAWDEDRSPAIPATIAQYWNDAAPPDDIVALMQSWRTHNPQYRYRRFDHDSARGFLKAHCPPAVLRAYLRAREPAMKADVFRLAYLFVEGGCYVDADDRCLRPLDGLLPAPASFVAFQEEYGTLGNNFLAAAPQHPLLGLALQQAVQAINRGDDDMMWLSTGPGLMTRALAQTLAISVLLPEAWLARTRILDRHELECVVATHCAVSYKHSRRHWLRATFGQPKAPTPAAVPAI